MTSDWFAPEQFIRIGSSGGNIGRFHWSNQATLVAEQYGDNFREITRFELPGCSAFLWREFDWVGWLMGGFDHI